MRECRWAVSRMMRPHARRAAQACSEQDDLGGAPLAVRPRGSPRPIASGSDSTVPLRDSARPLIRNAIAVHEADAVATRVGHEERRSVMDLFDVLVLTAMGTLAAFFLLVAVWEWRDKRDHQADAQVIQHPSTDRRVNPAA